MNPIYDHNIILTINHGFNGEISDSSRALSLAECHREGWQVLDSRDGSCHFSWPWKKNVYKDCIYHLYTHICMYIYTCICTYVHMYICTYVCILIYIHTYIHTYIYIYIYTTIYVYPYFFLNVCLHLYSLAPRNCGFSIVQPSSSRGQESPVLTLELELSHCG